MINSSSKNMITKMLKTRPCSFERYPCLYYIFPNVLNFWYLKPYSSHPFLPHNTLYHIKLILLYLLWYRIFVMEKYSLLVFRIIIYAKGVKVLFVLGFFKILLCFVSLALSVVWECLQNQMGRFPLILPTHSPVPWIICQVVTPQKLTGVIKLRGAS